MLSRRMKNFTRHLLCCSAVEEETFHLYQCVAKRMNNPELRSLVVNISYDSMKHSKTIRELLKTVEKTEINIKKCRKNWSDLWKEIIEVSEQVSKMQTVHDDEFHEIFQGLAQLEDCLIESYCFLLEHKIPESLANELGKLTPINMDNLNKIFDGIIEDKQRHKETLIEIGYCYASKDSIGAEDSTPAVRYQNPDAWHKEQIAQSEF
jgi:rubrerythrin